MEYREICYPSASGLSNIYAYIWEPSASVSPLGVVQISHGMAEHARRYAPFAEFLTEKGFVVCANDHLGHGKSANGQFGFMGPSNGHKTLVKDVYKLFTIMKKDFKDIPYVLLGHSMGSLIVRYACSLWGLEFDGAIFCGTSNKSNALAVVSTYSTAMGHLFGKEKEAHSIYNTMQAAMNKPFHKNGEKGSHLWLTRDKEERKKVEADPLCDFPFTFAGYKDLAKLASIVSSKQWENRIPRDLPILLISGLNDTVGDFGRGVVEVFNTLQEVGCDQVEIKLYEESRHEIFFELNKAEVYEDVYNWLMENVVTAFS